MGYGSAGSGRKTTGAFFEAAPPGSPIRPVVALVRRFDRRRMRVADEFALEFTQIRPDFF